MKPQQRTLKLFGPDRTTVKRTVEIADPFGNEIRFVGDIATQQRAHPRDKPLADGRDHAVTSCVHDDATSWLGVRWYGLPWPKRLRLRQPRNGRRATWLPIWIIEAPGCGCIVKLKALIEGLKLTAQAVRRA